jgi:hypothetical protein
MFEGANAPTLLMSRDVFHRITQRSFRANTLRCECVNMFTQLQNLTRTDAMRQLWERSQKTNASLLRNISKFLQIFEETPEASGDNERHSLLLEI